VQPETLCIHVCSVVVKALCCKPEGHGLETRRGHGMFSIYLILPAALGPGVYSASNRNEDPKQRNKYFWGVKCGGCVGLTAWDPQHLTTLFLISLNGPHLRILVQAPLDYVSGILTTTLWSWFSGQPFVQTTDWKEQSIQSISPLKLCEAVTLIGMVSSVKRSARYYTGATYRGCCHGNVYTYEFFV
jgi:hypothetical protein